MTVCVKDYSGDMHHITSIGLNYEEMVQRFGFYLAIVLSFALRPNMVGQDKEFKLFIESDIEEMFESEALQKIAWQNLYNFAYCDVLRKAIKEASPFEIDTLLIRKVQLNEEDEFTKAIKEEQYPDVLAALYGGALSDLYKERIIRRIAWLMDPSFN